MNRDIDAVIARVQRTHPGVVVEQLQVSHPGADDDGIWFFSHPAVCGNVQVESSSGCTPFVVESDWDPANAANTVDDAVREVCRRLGLPDESA
jgi:hypothetical protein